MGLTSIPCPKATILVTLESRSSTYGQKSHEGLPSTNSRSGGKPVAWNSKLGPKTWSQLIEHRPHACYGPLKLSPYVYVDF